LRPVALAVDESEEYPLEQVRRAAELGLTCYDLPVEYGGGGVERLRERCAVIEELSWGDSPIFWVIGQVGFFAGPILALGSAEQKRRWLPPLCEADPPICAVAITEPEHGSDSAAIETTARRVDGGYVIDGRKKFIGNGAIADLCIVFATVRPGSRAKGVTAFVVERDDAGFVRGPSLPKMGSRCFPAAEVAFDGCFVPEERRLGEEGQGFAGLMWVFDVARVQLAASSLGMGRAALELAVEHAREREAFGRKIHEFQAVSFRLADAKLKLDQARLLTLHAAGLADAGEPFSTEAAMAKLAASEASVFATSAAVTTLGGAGYIRDSLAQKWYRDAKLDEIWDGTSDIMRLIVARSLFR
jgi:acyl-CoA dehydrogenase